MDATAEAEFLSTGEVAARLGVHRVTVHRAVARGDLHAARLGRRGRLLIPTAEVARLLDASQREEAES